MSCADCTKNRLQGRKETHELWESRLRRLREHYNEWKNYDLVSDALKRAVDIMEGKYPLKDQGAQQ